MGGGGRQRDPKQVAGQVGGEALGGVVEARDWNGVLAMGREWNVVLVKEARVAGDGVRAVPGRAEDGFGGG